MKVFQFLDGAKKECRYFAVNNRKANDIQNTTAKSISHLGSWPIPAMTIVFVNGQRHRHRRHSHISLPQENNIVLNFCHIFSSPHSMKLKVSKTHIETSE